MFEIHLKLNDSRHVWLKTFSYNLFNSKADRINCCQSITFIDFIFYYFLLFWLRLFLLNSLHNIVRLVWPKNNFSLICFFVLFCFPISFWLSYNIFLFFCFVCTHIVYCMHCAQYTVARSIKPTVFYSTCFLIFKWEKRVEIQTQSLEIQKVDKSLCGIWWSLNVSGSAELNSSFRFII